MSAPVLQVQGLCKYFGGVRAVDGLDLTVQAGECVALIGPNGAGKSTTFNLINGQLRADAGQILLAGQRLRGGDPQAVWALGVGRTFQVAQTFASFTVLQNVQVALLSAQRQWWSPFASAHAAHADAALRLLAQVGLADQAQRPCSALAYGDVKRLELALALAHQPRVLLMDEPTAGMSPAERHALMTLTTDLVRARDMALLFTEHSMDVVFAHAQRIVVMAQGRCLANDTPARVRDNAHVRRVYLGPDAPEKNA